MTTTMPGRADLPCLVGPHLSFAVSSRIGGLPDFSGGLPLARGNLTPKSGEVASSTAISAVQAA